MSQTKAQLLNPQGDFTLTGQLIGVGATFSGNVSIAGTLTKQDVTNVDSVGVITARSDIIVGGNIAHLGDTDTKIAFTNNQIDFQANNSSRLYVNQYATYLQTAYPLAFLSSSGASPSIKSGGTNNQDLLLTTGTSNPTRIHIKSDGKIGIGTNNPSSQLDLSGTNTTVWPFTSDVSNVYAYSPYPHELQIQNHARDVTGAFAGIYFHSGASADGSYVSAARIAAIDSGNYKSDLVFATRNTAFKERLRIAADGKVGIGDSDPDALLSIKGDSNQNSNPSIRLKDGTDTRETWISNVSGDLFLAAGGNDNVYHSRIRLMDGNMINFDINNGLRATIDADGVSDAKGNLRIIPQNAQTGSSIYEFVAADAGKHILRSGGHVRLPSNVFAAGTPITVINNSASDINFIAGSGVTLYNTADAAVGQRTLAARGMATVLYTTAGANVNAYISGSGLS